MTKELVGVILTYNEAHNIADCIASLRWADAVIVLDSYSTDDTVQIARAHGAVVHQRAFDNYAAQRNAALALLERESQWVLFVDADERVTPELAVEARQLIKQAGYGGWRIPRYNYIFGHVMRGAGWYPDYQTRLLRIGHAHYDPSRTVHEVVILDGQEGTASGHFRHYNYLTRAQFNHKQRKYSAYDAQILYDQGVRPKWRHYITQPARHFWWRFVTLRGYRDHWRGLELCLRMAWWEGYKYWLLAHLWRGERPTATPPATCA